MCHCFKSIETGCDFLFDVDVLVERKMCDIRNAENVSAMSVWNVVVIDGDTWYIFVFLCLVCD